MSFARLLRSSSRKSNRARAARATVYITEVTFTTRTVYEKSCANKRFLPRNHRLSAVYLPTVKRQRERARP